MFAAPLNSRTFPKAITKNSDKRPAAAFAKKAAAVGTRAAGTAVVLDGVVRFGLGGVGVSVHHQRHFGKRRQGAGRKLAADRILHPAVGAGLAGVGVLVYLSAI